MAKVPLFASTRDFPNMDSFADIFATFIIAHSIIWPRVSHCVKEGIFLVDGVVGLP